MKKKWLSNRKAISLYIVVFFLGELLIIYFYHKYIVLQLFDLLNTI